MFFHLAKIKISKVNTHLDLICIQYEWAHLTSPLAQYKLNGGTVFVSSGGSELKQ